MSQCTSCGGAIENTMVTGIFCGTCHGAEVDTGGNTYVKGAIGLGGAAGMLPFFFHINVNGLSYVALVCGLVAIVAGAMAVVRALRSEVRDNKTIALAAVPLLLGLFHVATSGALF